MLVSKMNIHIKIARDAYVDANTKQNTANTRHVEHMLMSSPSSYQQIQPSPVEAPFCLWIVKQQTETDSKKYLTIAFMHFIFKIASND